MVLSCGMSTCKCIKPFWRSISFVTGSKSSSMEHQSAPSSRAFWMVLATRCSCSFGLGLDGKLIMILVFVDPTEVFLFISICLFKIKAFTDALWERQVAPRKYSKSRVLKFLHDSMIPPSLQTWRKTRCIGLAKISQTTTCIHDYPLFGDLRSRQRFQKATNVSSATYSMPMTMRSGHV